LMKSECDQYEQEEERKNMKKVLALPPSKGGKKFTPADLETKSTKELFSIFTSCQIERPRGINSKDDMKTHLLGGAKVVKGVGWLGDIKASGGNLTAANMKALTNDQIRAVVRHFKIENNLSVPRGVDTRDGLKNLIVGRVLTPQAIKALETPVASPLLAAANEVATGKRRNSAGASSSSSSSSTTVVFAAKRVKLPNQSGSSGSSSRS
jgi:hypothetical protein